MTTWNYRLCKVTENVIGRKVVSYGIYKVYYENGKPTPITEKPAYPLGTDDTEREALSEFNQDLNAYIRATVLPVLEWNDKLNHFVEVNNGE